MLSVIFIRLLLHIIVIFFYNLSPVFTIWRSCFVSRLNLTYITIHSHMDYLETIFSINDHTMCHGSHLYFLVIQLLVSLFDPPLSICVVKLKFWYTWFLRYFCYDSFYSVICSTLIVSSIEEIINYGTSSIINIKSVHSQSFTFEIIFLRMFGLLTMVILIIWHLFPCYYPHLLHCRIFLMLLVEDFHARVVGTVKIDLQPSFKLQLYFNFLSFPIITFYLKA